MMVMPSSRTPGQLCNTQGATHKELVACLSRSLDLWTDGQFQDLLREGRVVQEHLECMTKRGKQCTQADQEEDEARFFGRRMFQGKVKGALRALSESGRGRVLMLDEETSPGVTVREALKSKHPPAGSVYTSGLLDEQPPDSHPIIFECLNGNMVRSAALHCQGSAGPSELDASNWHRLCTMFHGSSKSLCSAVAAAARRLCTSYVDPWCIGPLTACRLIPLSKDPGVRPISGSVRRCSESSGKPFCKLLETTSRQRVAPLSSVHSSGQGVRQ